MLTETEQFLKDPSHKLVKAPREGQLAMAKRVATTFIDGGVAFVEAPVGTGKSYAYSVPAVLSGQRTVIATAKKTLQEQLVGKDLPAVKRATGKLFSFTVLKGAGNYFCASRAQAVKDKNVRKQLNEWQFMLSDIASDGDVSSFPGKKPDFWPDVRVETCEGPRCSFYAECGYARLLKSAQEATVVVTNHHVLAHALARGSNVLGEYRNLVIDEAHQFPGALRSAQTRELSSSVLNNLYRSYVQAGGVNSDKALNSAWRALLGTLPRKESIVTPDMFSSFVEPLQTQLTILADDIRSAALEVERDGGGVQQRAAIRSFQYVILKVSAAADALTADNANFVTSVSEPDPKTGARTLKSQPLYPGAVVSAVLKEVRSVVATSATLSVNGDFTYIARELGLPAPGTGNSHGLRCASPFNYDRQAVLYTPKHLPLPVSEPGAAREAWLDAASAEIAQLIDASDGNTLVLFSAMSDLRGVAARLQTSVTHPLIIQESDNAEMAEEQYRNTDNAVLLGSKSFFEGLSIEGDKLWSVIILKLPFPSPNDPVMATKKARIVERMVDAGHTEDSASRAAFRNLTLPQMLTDVTQASGRLLRTVTDRGVLTILDPRIWTGRNALPTLDHLTYNGYGLDVITSLGFTQRTSKFPIVQRYFTKLRTS